MGKFKVKKVLCLGMSLMCLVCGCSDESNNSLSRNNPVSISVWNYYNGQQLVSFENIVKEFNESIGKEKGIIVELNSKGAINTLYDDIKKSAAKDVGAEKMPDVFATYTDFAYEMDEKSLLVDLNQYFNSKELDEFVDGYLEEGYISKDNSLKVIPFAKATELLMINGTDFDDFAKKANVKYSDLSTIEGIVDVSKKYYKYTDDLTEQPNDGKAFFGRDSIANYMFAGAKQLGDNVYTVKDGKATITLSEKTARKLWDNYYVPYISGYFAANGRFRSDDAKTLDILAFVASSTSATYFPKEVVDNNGNTHKVECKILKTPKFKDGQDYAVQQGAGFSIAKSDKIHELASSEFLKWVTNKKQNIEFTVKSSYIPVKKSVSTYNQIVDENNGIEGISNVTQEALKVSLDSVASSKLFYAPPFEKSNDLRNKVSDSLETIAFKNRKKVVEILKSTSLEKAVSMYNTEKVFNDWYIKLKSDLEAIIK